MQRTHIIPATLILLSLVSCSTQPLAPDEVIKRSIIHSHTVESLTLALSADMRTEKNSALSGSVIIQGVVRSGGQLWSADASFNLESTLRRGHERASGRVVLVSPGDGRVYLRPESIAGKLGDLIRLSLTGSLNGWWMTGDAMPQQATARRTPDPNILSGYADAITVLEDLGIERLGSGRHYHYRVALKPEALSSVPGGDAGTTVTGEGELWINSNDFSLSRALWNLHGIPTSLGPVFLKADILFAGYNKAPSIHVPAGSSSILPLESIFAIFSG